MLFDQENSAVREYEKEDQFSMLNTQMTLCDNEDCKEKESEKEEEKSFCSTEKENGEILKEELTLLIQRLPYQLQGTVKKQCSFVGVDCEAFDCDSLPTMKKMLQKKQGKTCFLDNTERKQKEEEAGQFQSKIENEKLMRDFIESRNLQGDIMLQEIIQGNRFILLEIYQEVIQLQNRDSSINEVRLTKNYMKCFYRKKRSRNIENVYLTFYKETKEKFDMKGMENYQLIVHEYDNDNNTEQSEARLS